MPFTLYVRAEELKTVSHFLIAILLGISLLILSAIPFEAGIEGVIVETNPFFWVLLAVSLGYAIAVRKRYSYSSLAILFFAGLSLRLIPAMHSLYPGVDPWGELASVHHIQATGFNLRGNYAHSSLPVLQTLLVLLMPVSGQYNTIVFFGPIFGWILAFICLYKLAREFFNMENAFLVLLLYACANISYQYLSTPETIALGIGFATVFFFHRNLVKPSLRYTLATIGVFILLIFTHHLTAFCVLLATGAIMAVLTFQKRKTTNLFVWFSMLVAFLLYFQVYQNMLSSLLSFQLAHPMVGVPTGWSKPLWWWIIYVLPNAFLLFLLAAWILPFLMKKKVPESSEIFAMVLAGGFSFVFSFLIPQSLPPLRLMNQFGGYFFMGAASLSVHGHAKRSNFLIIILSAILLLGLVTAFPITNKTDFYVGGYWISHSSDEILALQYLAANATVGSRIAADGRCRGIIIGLAPVEINLVTPTIYDISEIYNTNSTQEAWSYCINDSISYVFVSKFYEVIAQFSVYGGGMKFSEAQLSKFTPPYFTLWYSNAEASIYLVNPKAV